MSDVYLGEIRAVSFFFVPHAWARCEGQLLPIVTNTALFSVIGTYYGGDGIQTFALPDLRASALIGTGSGAGLTPRAIADRGGAMAVALTETQLPAHTHGIRGSSARGNKTTPAGNTWAADGSGRTMDYQTAAPNDTMQANLLTPVGGGQTHNNMQPYVALQYIISLQGIFPSRA